MEELNQLLDFGESYPQFVAYHCFGDKATEFLSSLQQPYKDIVTYKPELGIRNVCKKLVISLYFCNFIVENQSITTNITMITKDKITEIFCIADDFCKEFELETDKISLSERNKGCHRHRRWRMSKSEIITILICFHFSSYRNFRHYYTFFVKEHLADLFPNYWCPIKLFLRSYLFNSE